MTKILVIADVMDNAGLLSFELEQRGCHALTASSGRQGLEVAADEHPDVILLDVMMPDMDGIEVCRKLKADPETRMIPVILVAAMGLDENAIRKANADLEQIFNAAAPMAVIGSDNTLLKVNDACAALLRMEKGQIIGRRCCDLLAGSVCGTPDCCLKRVARGETCAIEQEKYLSGGRTVPCIVKSHPYRNERGEIIGCVQSLTDISSLKQAEHALRESERKYRTLFESSRDAIMTLTADEGFLSGNAATVELFGCRDEKDFCVYGPADLSPEYQPDGQLSAVKAREMMATALEKGSHFFEWTHKRVDGREFSATVLLTRMELDGKAMLQATVRDISEQKEREAQVERLNRELVETSRRAGMAEVATGVLHNIGNVLNSVNVSANLIAEKLNASRVARVSSLAALLDEHSDHLMDFLVADSRGSQLPEYLKVLGKHLEDEKAFILDELDGLLQNIEHVKEIINLQQTHSRVSGVLEVVRLDEVLDGAVKLNSASFLRHNVRIVRDYEEVPPLTLDKHRLLQILVNLISNAKDALKASTGDDKRLVLGIAAEEPHGVAITVSDNGVGIRPEHMSRIFEHGFTTKQGGHGFGLHSSALAAQELGGSLKVDSGGPGCGASFRLELPLSVEEAALCTA